MRLKKIVLGLSAVAAAAILAACSSGSNASGNAPALAANTGQSTVSQSSPAATSTTTAAPTTTTTVAPPPATTTPPIKTKPPVKTTTKAPVQATEAAATTPCTITTGACVDLSERKTWLLKDGVVIYGPVHAEPGRTGWSTPVGTFHVTAHVKNYVSHEFNAPMPYATFFLPGIAFHVGSASTPSHGCVHLSQAAAETYFQDLAVGEDVQIVR